MAMKTLSTSGKKLMLVQKLAAFIVMSILVTHEDGNSSYLLLKRKRRCLEHLSETDMRRLIKKSVSSDVGTVTLIPENFGFAFSDHRFGNFLFWNSEIFVNIRWSIVDIQWKLKMR